MNSGIMTKSNLPMTYFDTPEKSDEKVLKTERDKLLDNSLVQELLEGYTELVVILNKDRQIVACNTKALGTFGAESVEEILGSRVGEALNCIHGGELPAGCGTSKFCAECGAAKAIKGTKEENKPFIEECRITAEKDGFEYPLDLEVNTRPIFIEDTYYTLFAIKDIADERRRNALERIFFHDVLNTSGVINGIASVFPSLKTDEDRTRISGMLKTSSLQLIEEIKAQRELRNAEDGNLEPEFRETNVNDILKRAFDIYEMSDLRKHKNFSVKYLEEDCEIITDQSLLIRSLGNLIKNALEAVDKEGRVEIYAEPSDKHILFCIYSDKVIPENVQLQIFQRSFSTKATRGRGIGTYSVKLLTEQYLKGKVFFESNNDVKTVFKILLPLEV